MADPQKLERTTRAVSVRMREERRILLADGYAVKFSDDVSLSATGHLVVFEIRNPQASAYFEGRWDHEEAKLKIDLEGVSKNEKRRFKTGVRGRGHHASRKGQDDYVYEIDIDYPEAKIYHAIVRLTLNVIGHVEFGIQFGSLFKVP